MKTKNLIKYLFAFVLVLSLVGCTSNNTGGDNPYSGTPDKDMVTVNLSAEPPTLNSTMISNTVSEVILRMTMSGLVTLDKESQIAPDIADKWEVSEDFKTYTFSLRKDAKWSNGKTVTANDFVYAWQMILTPSFASEVADALLPVIKNGEAYYKGEVTKEQLGVKATDDYTLVVELQDPKPDFLYLLTTSAFLPIHQESFEAIGTTAYGTEADKIITNGPYKVAQWQHDDNIIVEKNDDFYNAKNINVAKVKYVMINDSSAAMNAFKAGQLDAFDIIGDQITDLEAQGKDVVKKYHDNAVFVLQFNMTKKETSNAKINKALVMALDTTSLCDNVFKDGSTIATGIVAPSIISTNGEDTYASKRGDLISYNTSEAKNLLDEGLKELNTTAKDLKLTYLANDSTIGRLQGEFLKDQWLKALGIDVTIELIPFNARVERLKNGDFDLTFNGWSTSSSDTLEYVSLMINDSANNFGKYNNPKFDEYIAKATQETDLEKREEYIIEAEKIVMEDGAMLPLYHTCIVYAVSNKIEGMICDAYQKYSFINGATIK